MKRLVSSILLFVLHLGVFAQTSPLPYGTPFYYYEMLDKEKKVSTGCYYLAGDNTLCFYLPSIKKTAMIKPNSEMKISKTGKQCIYFFPENPNPPVNRAYRFGFITREGSNECELFMNVFNEKKLHQLRAYNSSDDFWAKLKSTLDTLPFVRTYIKK